jgi:hypothetical protein
MSGWMVIDITSFTKTTTADKVKKILKTVRHAPPHPILAGWVAGSIWKKIPKTVRLASPLTQHWQAGWQVVSGLALPLHLPLSFIGRLYLIHREKIGQERGTEGGVIAGTARKLGSLSVYFLYG